MSRTTYDPYDQLDQYDFSGLPDPPSQNQSQYDFGGLPDRTPYDFSGLPDPPTEKSWLQQWEEHPVNQPLLDRWRRGSVIPGAGERVIDPQRRANEIDPIEGRNESQWRLPEWIPGIGGGTYRSLLAGTVEGLGEFARMSSTPLNLATMGAFEGESLATKYGLAIPAEYLGLMGRGMSVPVAGQAANEIYQGIITGDYGKAARGIPMLAGGVAGMFGPSHATNPTTPETVPASEPNLSARPPVRPIEPSGRGANVPEGWLPFGQLPEGRYTSPTPFFEHPEVQPDLPFGEPQQQSLDLGAYRSPAGRFARTGPSAQPRVRPFFEEPFQGHLDLGDVTSTTPGDLTAPFNRPDPSTRPPVEVPVMEPTVEPTAPVLESGVEVVNGQERVTRRNWNEAQLKYWKERGFIPGGLTSDGQIYMVRGSTTPEVSPEPPPTPKEQATRGAVGRNEIPIDQNEITVPTHQATDRTVAFLKTKGFELIDESNGQSTFKKTPTSEVPKSKSGNERGSVNIDLITLGLRRILGREPTPTEISHQLTPEEATVETVHPGEELSDQALINRSRETDHNAINSNNNLNRAVELRDFWRQELDAENRGGDADSQKHAQSMLNRATGRERYLREMASYEPTPTPPPEPAPAARATGSIINNEVNRQEIADARNFHEAANIGTRWFDISMDRSNTREVRDHATQMMRLAHQRVYNFANINTSGWQTIDTSTEPPTRAPGATRLGGSNPSPVVNPTEPPITPARETNPPITFGPREYDPRTKGRITQAEYDRLRGSVNETQVAVEEAKRARDPITGKRLHKVTKGVNTWDRWAQDQIQNDTQDGPPGLHIEKAYDWSSNTDKGYKIVYRDTNGKVVGFARVMEDYHTGQRKVPTWAVDNSRGPVLAARAFHAIAKTMLETNAAAASGSISHNTARVIAMAKRLIRNESGSINMDMLTLGLSNLLDRVSSNVNEPTKTNVLDDMMHESGVTEGPLRRFHTETGAILLPSREGIKNAVGGFFKEGSNKEPSTFQEAMALPGAAMTTGDVSMPLRQGFSQIFTPEWWKALKPMFEAGFSADRAAAIDAQIRSNPIHQTKFDTFTQKEIPSMAKQMGVTLIEDGKISKSEYSIGSNWIENGGNIPGFSEGYRRTVGKYVTKPSNRAAATFLNHLRTYATEKLLNSARDMAVEAADTGRAPYPGVMGGVKLPEMMGGKRIGFTRSYNLEETGNLNPYNNVKLAREIGDFVNTATGRGPLRTPWIPIEGAPEINLEGAANVLKYTLFSPRGLASKVRMMNPNTYIMANPMVRKEYLKAFLGVAAGWYTMLQLVKGAGALSGNKVSVSTDMNSSDFGKARVGNVRLDLGGGFQQPLVLMHRLATGQVTSSATGRQFELGQGFRAPTRREMIQNFMVNKENPIAKFAYDMANASTHQPFHVADRTIQMFVPLIIGDMLDIAKQDPKLLPGVMPFVAMGGGSQAYDRGESEGKFIPPKNDILFQGGGNMLPWNWIK